MNNTKNDKIRLRVFLASAVGVFVIFSLIQTTNAFFSDLNNIINRPSIVASTLSIDAFDFQINNSGVWSNALTNWAPYSVSELRFTVDNVGYNDVTLIDTLKMSWDDVSLDPLVFVLYPSSMSDADIVSDITSPSPNYAIFGMVDSEDDKSFVSFELDDGRLNGSQSSIDVSDKTRTFSYKLVFNHGSDSAYEDKTASISLSSLARYYHDPDIAWNSLKDDLESISITTAVASGNLFEVAFDANGGSGAPTSLKYRSDFDLSHSFSLPDSVPSYGLSNVFMGWSLDPTATNASLQPGETFTVGSGMTTLYAVWKNSFSIAFESAGKAMSNNHYVMQDMTTSICDAVITPTVLDDAPATQLVDSRDSKMYWVSKLADGKCWMTQNLDFDLKTNTQLSNMTSDLNTKNSWTPSSNTINVSNNATTTGNNASFSWNGSANNAASLDVGNVYYIYNPSVNAISACPTNGFLSNACSVVFSNIPSSDSGEHGHVGNYYSFPAAVAQSSVRSQQTYTDSICPAHWRIAYSTGSDDYANLASTYGANGYDDVLLMAPVYFVRSGYIIAKGSSLQSAGDLGQMWTANIRQNTNNKTVGFEHSASSAATVTELAPGNGATVRCIAR